MHRGRKGLPRRRTPHACGWCHRRAGCLRNFNKGHTTSGTFGMTRRRLACTPQRRLVGAARRGCAFQPPRRRAREWIVERPAPRRLRYGRGKVNACPRQKPAGGRMMPPYRYGEGVHAAGRHGAGRSCFPRAPCGRRGYGWRGMARPAPVSSRAVMQVVLWGAWSESQEKGTSAAKPPGAHPRSPAGDSRFPVLFGEGGAPFRCQGARSARLRPAPSKEAIAALGCA